MGADDTDTDEVVLVVRYTPQDRSAVLNMRSNLSNNSIIDASGGEWTWTRWRTKRPHPRWEGGCWGRTKARKDGALGARMVRAWKAVRWARPPASEAQMGVWDHAGCILLDDVRDGFKAGQMEFGPSELEEGMVVEP